MTRKFAAELLTVAFIAAAVTLTSISFATSPVARCHGYLHVPLKHPMSDLYGGAVEHDYAKCRAR